jgi:hypothetical protein
MATILRMIEDMTVGRRRSSPTGYGQTAAVAEKLPPVLTPEEIARLLEAVAGVPTASR